MFTGIIENVGEIVSIERQNDNITFGIECDISKDLKVDQSVSHNGVCLTVTNCNEHAHKVVAIKETLEKSSLGALKKGDPINIERAMKMGGRLDGHMVQGHVDDTAKCTYIKDENGSWVFEFEYNQKFEALLIDKGSICINGISLTVFNIDANRFSVAIIPYTYENTNFQALKIGDLVNIEYDMIGKYLNRFKTLNN